LIQCCLLARLLDLLVKRDYHGLEGVLVDELAEFAVEIEVEDLYGPRLLARNCYYLERVIVVEDDRHLLFAYAFIDDDSPLPVVVHVDFYGLASPHR
jgi:hypothetical protein